MLSRSLFSFSSAVLLGMFFILQLIQTNPQIVSISNSAVGQILNKEPTTHTTFFQSNQVEFSAVKTATVHRSENYDSLMFVGDVLLARNVEFLIQQHGYTYPYEGVTFHNYSANPAVMVNFESAIPIVHTPTPPLQLQFSTPKELIPALSENGVTHASLANNHSYDFGALDFAHTRDVLVANQIEPFGDPVLLSSSSVSFITIDENIVAVAALSPLTRVAYSTEELRALFSFMNKRSDYQFVYIHWGEEYSSESNQSQKKLATRLIFHGADAIIGHHPHVVQEIELISGVPVFYSLGNYIFDQYFNVDVQIGLVLQFSSTDRSGFYLLPVSSKQHKSQPQPLTKLQHALFLQDLAKRSDPELYSYIKSGFIPFSIVASSSKIAMID